MAEPDMPTDEKYITFKRQDFLEWLSETAADGWMKDVNNLTLHDAVVIRRQDLFAGPCLATYANMIALVARGTDDKAVAKELLQIADYFEDQARLAHEEGYKYPDL